MQRFTDPDAEEIYTTGVSRRLPKGVARKAYRRLHLLLAARSLQDIAVMGPIARWPRAPSTYGVHVDGKWFIRFKWENLLGAFDIKLARFSPAKIQG